VADQVITGVGAELKRAREAAGLAIGDVARRLKLLPRQIESLEGERFDRLPGPAIARGMVRNYARVLELDPEPLVERMAPPGNQVPEPALVPPRRAPMPSASAGRHSTLLYAGFSVVLLAAIGAFAYQWQLKKGAPELVARVEPQPVQAPVEQKPVQEKPAPEKPAEPPAAVEAPPVIAAQAAPAPEPKVEAVSVPAPRPGVHRLVLRTEEEAWLEVRDSEGRNLVSSLNPAGGERAVRGQPPFELVIGNAAHVRLTYNGKPVDLAPHTKGEVARFTLQ
jgi:cytoskeleton protein RodZ